jgi:hypothetical protein
MIVYTYVLSVIGKLHYIYKGTNTSSPHKTNKIYLLRVQGVRVSVERAPGVMQRESDQQQNSL